MKICLNGIATEIEGQYIEAICSKNQQNHDVYIVNGYQVSRDYQLNEGDEVYLIEKGMMPDQEVLEAMMVARHTPGVHSKVKQAKVVVAGLGGLGSHIAVSLARTGVGHLLLVDFDVVEPSNLNRQNYSIKHLGLFKTLALKEQLEDINPFIQVDVKTVRVTEENIKGLFEAYDIVCEAFDQAEAKAMLVNTVLTELPHIKVVASSGMAGYESANQIQTYKRMSRLYVCGDLQNEAQVGKGLMAPRVQVCAGHQANMVLRLILGEENA